jgi:hypothetical protein
MREREINSSEGKMMRVLIFALEVDHGAHRWGLEHFDDTGSEVRYLTVLDLGGLGFSNITMAGHGVPSPLPSTFQSASNSLQQAEAKGEGHAQTCTMLVQSESKFSTCPV